jgi:hypothetical protein
MSCGQSPKKRIGRRLALAGNAPITAVSWPFKRTIILRITDISVVGEQSV